MPDRSRRHLSATAAAQSGLDPPGRAGTSRLWVWLLLSGLVLVLLYLVLPSGLGRDAIYVGVGLLGSAAILFGVVLYRPRHRLPWYLMAAGQLIWSLGDAINSWYGDVLGDDGFPTPADACYLLAYPLLGFGLGLLIRIRRPGRDLPGLLDSATLTAGLGLLAWVLLAEPTVSQYRDSPGAALVALAYPLMDVMLLALVLRLRILPGGGNWSLRLLVIAAALLIIADSLATGLSLLTFDATNKIDFLWLFSYLVWGAAALHPRMREVSAPAPPYRPGLSRTRLVAVALAALAAPTVLGVQQLLGLTLDVWPVVIGSVLLFLLVVARMWLSLRQVLALNRAREIAQDELAHQAAHDSLTGLANRAEVRKLIIGALSRAQRSGAIVGLLFVDLDGFKQVNDTLGHAAGDEVLRRVAARMLTEVRAGDVVARLGGDEFVVLLEPLDEQASAVLVAERVVTALAMPIPLENGRRARIGASVGVALSQDGGLDPDALLGEADAAVYRAKNGGRGRIEVFDASLRDELAHRSELEIGIAAAIEADELVLHYQPIIDLVGGQVQGYEALVRWDRPGVGLLPPSEFLPVAELSDLICELDAWVLRTATRQLAQWSSEPGAAELTMTVNVSGRHLARRRILDDVLDALDAAGLGTERLILEINEDAMADDPVTLTHLADLRALGVLISMDDFGSGYNSIARLEQLPIDIVKIDKKFIDRQSPASAKLLGLIVQAAHAFSLPVVAEGVERPEQLAVLRSVDCESAQGYLLGRPDQAATFSAEGEPDQGGPGFGAAFGD